MPLIVMFWVILFLLTFRKWIGLGLKKISPKLFYLKVKKIKQNLPNYYTSLSEESRKWTVSEETYCRTNLKFKTLLDETFEKL